MLPCVTAMEAVGTCLQEILLNDAVLSLLERSHLPDKRGLLTLFCLQGLEQLFGGIAHDDIAKLPVFGDDDIKSKASLAALEEFRKFAEMVCTLFMAGKEWNASSVNFFVNYPAQGPSLFAKAVRSLVTNTSAAEGLLAEMVADVVRTAASATTLRPKLEVAHSSIDQDEPTLDALLDASSMVKNFRDGLRKGECTTFQKLLVDKLADYVVRLCKDPNMQLTTKSIGALQDALAPFGSDSKVLQAQGQLMEFITKHNKKIAEEDLKEWAKVVCRDAPVGQGPFVDPAFLKSLISKCGAGVGAETQELTAKALVFGLKEILAEVGSGL